MKRPKRKATDIMKEMDTPEAIDIALEALEQRAAETDTASPEGHRVRLAIEVLEQLRDGSHDI